MFKWLINIFDNKIKHSWRTTHMNQWVHPTRQIDLKSDLSRRFEYFLPQLPVEVRINRKIKSFNGMPWEMGRWVWSNGKQSKYSVLD